jgi:hypothetical protein
MKRPQRISARVGSKSLQGKWWPGFATSASAALAVAILLSIAKSGSAQDKAATAQIITAEGTDPLFKEPYVDIDEWRDKPARHRYIHGGFKGTAARFSFYFPPKEQYQGRFFQHVTPVPASENLRQQSSGEEDFIGFSLASGAYFVETNEGSLSALATDPSISGYRVNSASADYSRTVATRMYGPHRPYGYAFGGSGGGYKTIGGFENTDTWDGVVPYVIGSPMAIPNVFTVRLLALRVLKERFASIMDAIEPGGSGDMYAGLNDEEQAVLREVTRMGFPPQGWFNYKTIGTGAFPILFGGVRHKDPEYFKDFWRVPGYVGTDAPESLMRSRIQHRTRVKKVLKASDPDTKAVLGGVDTAWQQLQAQAPVGYEVESTPAGNIEGAFLIVNSGEAAGKELPVGRIVGDAVLIGSNPFGGDNSQVLNGLKVGDEVVIDNSDYLAVHTYHRHQVPGSDYYVWDQFRGADGKPIYPQRPKLIAPEFAYSACGSLQSGRFRGKMIVVESIMDQDAFPWQADWYAAKVKAALGSRFNDQFRLWFTDRAVHGDETRQSDPRYTVSYLGVLHQALRDLSAWVEKGVAPPESTTYKVVDGQIELPLTAMQRKGVQPVVMLHANGKERAEVKPGEAVTLSGVIETPPNTGRVVSAEWSLEGAEEFTPAALNAQDGSRVEITTTHAFTRPGTYFPVLRAASQRHGDAKTPYARIQNLRRVRVVAR